MDDHFTQEYRAKFRGTRRQVRIRLAAVVLLVLVVVFNDQVIIRALCMALLVLLMRDFQRALNNRAVRKYHDDLMRYTEQHAAEYR
jgi:hypothetical protein